MSVQRENASAEEINFIVRKNGNTSEDFSKKPLHFRPHFVQAICSMGNGLFDNQEISEVLEDCRSGGKMEERWVCIFVGNIVTHLKTFQRN